jgi:uncharacterized protein
VARYLPRRLDAVVAGLLADLPAVLITGPRACGKTTSARQLAASTVRLDRPRDAGPFRADPDVAIAQYDPPVLLDEWQAVPGVLGAVKRSVDDDSSPGRFILTGSVRAELLEATWAATGRVVRVVQWGMSDRELAGGAAGPSLIDDLFAPDVEARLSALPRRRDGDVRDVVVRALRGGFPEAALARSDDARRRWLESYVDQLVMRDASLTEDARDPIRLRRYLNAFAANTAGVLPHKAIYDAAGINRETGESYSSLLELLFAIDLVPAYHSNRLNRLTRAPKRQLVDASLLGPLLGVDVRSVLRDNDLLGRVLDTYVTSQIRAEVEATDTRPQLLHLRQESGRHEVDLVLEAPGGRAVGIEIKADAAPTADAAQHLRWMRDSLGDRFACGVVFHPGEQPIRLDDRLFSLPISSLWGPPRSP